MGNKKNLMALLLFFPAFFLAAMPGRDSRNAELRFGVMSEPATLDPLSTANTADGRSLLFNVYEGLVKSDTSGRLVPASAESFEISKDAMVYTFTLRRDLRFHDGSQVTAGDIVYSVKDEMIEIYIFSMKYHYIKNSH